MQVSFLGQGLDQNDRSVGNELLKSFTDKDFYEFRCLVGFASAKGVELLFNALSNFRVNFSKFQIIVGIDEGGTPVDALRKLKELNLDVKIYHSPVLTIFHPKIYIFNGKTKCKIIVGSSNLTQQGLFQNIEASLMIYFEKPDQDGDAVLSDLDKYFATVYQENNPNVKTLSDSLIDTLLELNLVPNEGDELTHKKQQANSKANIDKIILLFPRTKVAKLPFVFDKNPKVVQSRLFNGIKSTSPSIKTTFLMELNKFGENAPGEFRIPLAARNQNPQLWGWPENYTKQQRNRGQKIRDYLEWKAQWLLISGNNKVIETVRIYFYLENEDFRFYSPTLIKWGAKEGDIVKISRESKDSSYIFICELVKKQDPNFKILKSKCTQSVRNSSRKYGFI